MQVYLVGGAVRDYILGRKVTEHDYVVVGATPQQMVDLGFSQVGADFPVFLHPKTHEEYALARTERKNGNGYHGFSVFADPNVTLEEDLIRRDLTINAMAIEVNGLFDSGFRQGAFNILNVIDPYGGLDDIQQRKLRHVSLAFAEDPVRVLRLARFASRYAPFGFTVDDSTKQLIEQMHHAGELNHLVAERVWSETSRALEQPWSDIYFDTLYQLNVLDVVIPKLYEASKTNFDQWHLILSALRLAGELKTDNLIKFALLSSCFSKNFSGNNLNDNNLNDNNLSENHLSKNYSSDNNGSNNFLELCQTLKVPKNFERFGLFFINQFEALNHFDKLDSCHFFDLIKASNSLKDTPFLQQALLTIHIYQLAKQSRLIQTVKSSLTQISAKDIDSDLKGKQIGEAIDNLRMIKLTEILNQSSE